MRLDEPIEASGVFWLPKEPGVRVPGNLHISESCEIRLEIRLDNLSPAWQDVISRGSPTNYEITRILGSVEGRGQITLDRCVVTGVHPTWGVGPIELKILANFAFTGCHYQMEEDVTFTEFTFSVEGIDEWLEVSGIQVESDLENARTLIDIRVPDEISLDLPDRTVLKFMFSINSPSVPKTITELHISQRGFVSLLSKEPRPLEYFTSLATQLRNFLRLAIGQPVSIDSATGYSTELTREDGAGGMSKVPIRAYYREARSSGPKQEVRWHHMLFGYDDVADHIAEILAKWLQSYEVYRPALDVYFTSMSDTSLSLEVEFLQRVQGIETLHRRSSQETEIPEEEFGGIVESLLLKCPDNRKEWLKGRLRYANEPSLRHRLKTMVEPFERFFGDSKRQGSFIAKVVVTRNYLTHYDGRLEDQAAKAGDLWELSLRLEALFQLHLLQSIGFDADRIDRAMQGSSNLSRLLRQADLIVPEFQSPKPKPR